MISSMKTQEGSRVHIVTSKDPLDYHTGISKLIDIFFLY